ncbi:putative disease resistance RPP13-like protein 3 [Macadamia integrifolia]|uniref:putative disease resistance RPP13-like protein 3 n=1 Tax=Macadamia integrifolia TaxID=60698 RepID=UPI001C4FDDF8|nr:putative disease resistance RPP13-like protein 3 [Macadamia integrifolia]
MAAGILSIVQRLASKLLDEADFLSGVQDQAQLLSDEIRLMSSVLQDALEKRRTGNEVEEWLKQVRDAVMKAEDVVDLIIFRAERQRKRNFLTRYIICYPNHLFYLRKLGKEIEKSIKKMNQLSIRRSTLGLATSEAGGQSSIGTIRIEQGLHFHRGDRVEDFFVIGFQEEEKEIVKKLLTPIELAQEPCPTVVVSIVGMGGSGKTTLARKIYKRNDVMNHFQTRAWISISQQYRIKDLLLVIIEQIKPLTPKEKDLDSLNVESLIHILSSHLRETTFLIVFDDLWRFQDWDMLKQALPLQGEGYQSRVLVTSRNEIVAIYANPSTTPYFQRLLNEDESWELFQAKVMGSKDVGCPEDLEDLGRRIVHKCHGLPLAIVVLGGLLSIRERTHIAWSKVLDSVNWELNQNERSCQQVLALSYTDLQDHLKPCFLYLGLFPEKYEIKRYRLIWLWVAEGFIEPRERSTMEDVAGDYIEELIQRSMIQPTSRSYDGRVTSCRIHDLVRDLAISKAKEERFLEVHGSDNLIPTNKSHRLSIIEPIEGVMLGPSTNYAPNQGTTPNHLHSLFCFSISMIIERNSWMTSTFGAMIKLLRVLDLEGAPVSSISYGSLDQIGKLIFLKYFSLRGTRITYLPDSIGELQNLQTLDLRHSYLQEMPTMKQHQLRHLVLYCPYDVPMLMRSDCSLEHLTNLQTLVLHSGNWIKSSLHKLINLRELCKVFGKHLRVLYKGALLDAIPKLKHLRGLRLIDRRTSLRSDGLAINLPVSFAGQLELYHLILMGINGIRDFPLNLTTLLLGSQTLQRTQMEILEKLPKLRCLILLEVHMGPAIIFPADGFLQLEELVLINLYHLYDFIMREGALQNLRVLMIQNCGLKGLPDELKRVVTLQELTWSLIPDGFEDMIREHIREDFGHIPSIATEPDFGLPERWLYDFGQLC